MQEASGSPLMWVVQLQVTMSLGKVSRAASSAHGQDTLHPGSTRREDGFDVTLKKRIRVEHRSEGSAI